MSVSFRFLCIICAAMMLCAACSGGKGASDAQNPVVPTLASVTSEISVGNNGRFLMGLWTVRINEDLTVEIAPNRMAEMHLNCVHLLEATCSDCLRITEVQILPDDGLSALLTLKHPFPGLMKFCAFDVRGIFISGADYDFPSSGKSIAWGDDIPRMVTYDGYTQLFNPTDFPQTVPLALGYIPGHKANGGDLSATLNPYIAFRQDYPRSIFEAGEVESRNVQLHVKNFPIEFGYAVDGCWQLVDEPVTDPITQFPADANALEAYRISVEVGSGIDIGGGFAPISTYVFDHQGLDTIESVTVESPDLFDGTIELSYAESDTDNKWHRYEGTIENSNQADYGEYPVLVRVVDTVADQNLGQIDAWQVYVCQVKRGWARTWGGTYHDFGSIVTTDPSGNVYITGTFGDTVDFDPGPGMVEYTSNGYDEVFLSKFDSSGYLQWVRTWGGIGQDYGNSVAIESSGNVYVTGSYSETVDFDPGDSIDNHTSNGYKDIFLSKFDSSGNFQWARTWGGIEPDDGGASVSVDSFGYVYITGYFESTVDFDPGDGVDKHTSSGSEDVFLNKFDSSGNLIWARTWGGIQQDLGFSVAIDSFDCVCISGHFCSTVDFDPGMGVDNHTSNGVNDAFLSKFGSSGDFQWARTWGGPEWETGISTAIDSLDNIYVTGSFRTTVDFDPGSGIDNHSSLGGYDAFLSKFNSSGYFQYALTWGGNSTDSGNSVAVDLSDNVYVAGDFRTTVDFDPDIGVDEHTSNGYNDAFLSKFDPFGTFQWVRTWGGSVPDVAESVVVDSNGCCYVTGMFWDTVDFDPGPGIDNHTSIGNTDVFLVKLMPDGYW